ncbi:hypothetical protein MTYP_02505 [Methylophilaceae bacterium]|nr:hypothetical protein MTYP_02505 [Methylophilaceae bacterium]
MDLVHRRRAVYTGLRPFLDDLRLMQALELWQQEFSHKPTFALNVFVAQCCTTPELKERRGEILRAVIHAMDLPVGKLLPDPQINTKSVADMQADAEYELDSVTTVFVLLLTQMLGKYDAVSQGGIRNYLLENLGQIKADQFSIARLKDWLAGYSSNLAANFGIEQLQQLINLAYVSMCQYVGPVKADQLLAQSLREVERQAAALKVNLRDFL